MKNLMTLIAVASMLISYNAFAQTTEISSVISVSISNEENSHSLMWTTQKEVNSSYFIVERSTDQVNYVTINRVKAAGYSLLNRSYEIEDTDADASFYYYRVVLVSMEGERTASIAVKAYDEVEHSLVAEK
ncbi:hypothetical protein [Aurantibacillus circumpalustris]|uniref:hypothetical protein n=1 Tax=Aurantibacillus circumpalustris TaxID=3036359 RepID=UPI00295B57DC|nr:hypothetical protein [Aurantibacillus circumpalustris]